MTDENPDTAHDPAPASATMTEAPTARTPTSTEIAEELRELGDPSLNAASEEKEEGPDEGRRQIQWVRPTDLVARLSAGAAERGVEWNNRADEWLRTNGRAAASDARHQLARLGRTLTQRVTRTGPDPAETEAVSVNGA